MGFTTVVLSAQASVVDRRTRNTHTGRMTGRPLRILLVDDHDTVRQGLKLLLDREADLKVTKEASNGRQAVETPALDDVDVVVMDVSMPGVSGIEATRQLKERRPDLPIVALTRHADDTLVHELLRVGASGYVLKQSPHTELLRAIRAVASRQTYVDPALAPAVAATFGPDGIARATRQRGITDRETDVLRLASRGYSNKEIAARLDVSSKTIEVHKTNAMRKLGLTGRLELLRFAVLRGWLNES